MPEAWSGLRGPVDRSIPDKPAGQAGPSRSRSVKKGGRSNLVWLYGRPHLSWNISGSRLIYPLD